MRKVLVGLLIGSAVAYGGLKLYVAHTVSQTADKMFALIAPVATVRYQGTTSSLDGSAGITGIHIEVLETGDIYQIDAFKLKTDSIFTLLGLDSKLREGEIPETFGIAIENMKMPVNTQLLDHAHGDPGLWGGLGLPYGSLACGDRDGFSVDDLYDMGLANTTTSLEVDVRREPSRGEIRFLVYVDSAGLNTSEIELIMAAPGGNFDPRAAMSAPPQIESASMTLQDQGWHMKMLDYCMGQTGMDKQTYLDAHVAAIKSALASDGIEVGDSLTNAYRQFVDDGGMMTIAFRPAGAVDLASLNFYSLQDALGYLGAQLSVNGETVTPLDIAEVNPAEVKPTATTRPKSPPKTVAPSGNIEFKVISIPELRQHVGKQVRLTTQRARVFEGKLADIQDRVARVAVQYGENVREEIVLLPMVKKAEVEVSAQTPANK